MDAPARCRRSVARPPFRLLTSSSQELFCIRPFRLSLSRLPLHLSSCAQVFSPPFSTSSSVRSLPRRRHRLSRSGTPQIVRLFNAVFRSLRDPTLAFSNRPFDKSSRGDLHRRWCVVHLMPPDSKGLSAPVYQSNPSCPQSLLKVSMS